MLGSWTPDRECERCERLGHQSPEQMQREAEECRGFRDDDGTGHCVYCKHAKGCHVK
jgi:hypothetical protein